MKERLRTFVAVELSDETRASLGRETARLASFGANVRWVAPSNIHVTLKFLGQVDRHAIPEVLKACEAVAKGAGPFRMALSGLSFFPKPTKPRVVAAGIDEEGARGLGGLASGLNDALVPMGFKKDERGFKAHVTLGRVKSPKGIKALADEIVTFAGGPFGEDAVDSITLFMSELRREGPVYTVLGHAKLGG